jgi:16S rRNA (cytosine967-C5)-methyltransferase
LPHVAFGIGVERIGDLAELAGFGHDFFAQDEAAQWAVDLAAQESGPALDLCAAPGGKTLALWDFNALPITAMDIQPARVELLQKTLAKAAVTAHVVKGDAAAPKLPADSFKCVLVDAPCTGSGTMKRHPEMRWRLEPSAITRLAGMQRAILAAAAPLVAPGGALIYSVCSVFDEEGPSQIVDFLQTHPNFRLDRWLDTLPMMDSMDGFFAVRLRRE